ncbi:MAG: O-antigen ligase family protein [Gammaproteobacteria bacterium]|nr:O-antigen ligase family protein [Gammaproteobacteria bacterium]
MPAISAHDLKLRSFIRDFRAETAALWFLCFYIFIEYLRPQNMYPVIDILPWGQLAIVASVVSVFLTRSRPLVFGALDKLFVVFSVIVILSSVFAWSTDASLKDWTAYASWILMYFCVVSVLTTPNRLLLFTIFFILINFKMSQHGVRVFAMRDFGFAHWGLSGAPGWFHNSGEFSLQMVIAFSMSLALLLALRDQVESKIRWWILIFLFPLTAALSVMGSSSRGGQLALATVILVLLLSGRRMWRNMAVITVMIVAMINVLPQEQLARFDSIGEDRTSESRLLLWEHAIETIKFNPMGIGYNNWAEYYETIYQPVRLEEIHNTILESFVDLGYPGGILFLIMIITAFVMNRRSRREALAMNTVEGRTVAAIASGLNLGLLGTFVAAVFMSVLFYPMFWLAFALTSALRHVSLHKLKEIKTHDSNRVAEKPSTVSPAIPSVYNSGQ